MTASPPPQPGSSPPKTVEEPATTAASPPQPAAQASPSRPTPPLTAAEQAAQDAAPIEADVADHDSAYEPSILSDTTSLKSSFRAYQWEYGRRYHADQEAKYWGPNDDKQQAAEDFSHDMHKLILDYNLHEAPLSNPQRVLDVGCGTGAWAIDFADEYPSAEVTGIDLSPIQTDFVPPNCHFEIDDMNKPWTFPEDHFDYVHLRSMLGTVPNWAEFHKTTFRHVKPGGWIEHVELSTLLRDEDGSFPPNSVLVEWGELFDQVGDKIGVSFRAAEEAHDAIAGAGFVNVTERIIKVPIGTWPRDKKLKAWGQWSQYFAVEGLEGFALRSFVDVLGWTYERAQIYLAGIRRALNNRDFHTYTQLHIVCGQKPV